MSTQLTISFDGRSWQTEDAAGNSMPLPCEQERLLPELPEGFVAGNVILPAEMLLIRSFSLPLSNPRFIDADILAQELEEQSGEDAGEWWISWLADSDGEGGVQGVLFALPEPIRALMQHDEKWSSAHFVGVDMQLHLANQLDRYRHCPDGSDNTLIVLYDCDDSGIFFGLCRLVENSQPIWLGMRRLNRSHASNEDGCITLASEIRHTVAAMAANQATVSAGRLPSDLFEQLAPAGWYGEVIDDVAAESRHIENLNADCALGLNFRHGSWRAQSLHGSGLTAWYKTMSLAAMLLLIWTAGILWQNDQLQRENDQLQARIIDAFHLGLPNESVIIDALAQLRKAAGSSGTLAGSNHTALFLSRLAVLNRVYNSNPWQMRELTLSGDEIVISGVAADLAAMNTIQQQLQQVSGSSVTLKDSDLSGSQVKFRMVWR